MQVLTISDDTGEAVEDEATLNERRLLSKYGVWLLAGKMNNTFISNLFIDLNMKDYSS